MRKMQLLGAASALYIALSAGFIGSNVAMAQEAGAGKSCRDNPAGGNIDHDTCVLSRNGSSGISPTSGSGSGDSAAWMCKVFEDAEILGLLGWTYGECVSNMKSS